MKPKWKGDGGGTTEVANTEIDQVGGGGADGVQEALK